MLILSSGAGVVLYQWLTFCGDFRRADISSWLQANLKSLMYFKTRSGFHKEDYFYKTYNNLGG